MLLFSLKDKDLVEANRIARKYGSVMAIKDTNVMVGAAFAKECIVMELGASAISQAALLTDSCIPGFAFEIVKVEVMATAVTATISVDVQINGVTALNAAVVPVANVPTAGVLALTAAARRGTKLEAIQLKYTSNGTGAATNLRVRVWIRPIPAQGEVLAT